MTPYGWRETFSRFVYGPGNFEMPVEGSRVADLVGPLTPFYLEPQFPGQRPFGGVVPDVGIFYYYPESIGTLGIEPAYLGVEE